MKYAKPADMGKSGDRLWSEIAGDGKYTLRPDEVRILEDACRTADMIDDLAEALVGQPKLVKGSMGQVVVNPLISELRQYRATFASLTGKLKLPDEGAGAPSVNQNRDAGSSRWNKSA